LSYGPTSRTQRVEGGTLVPPVRIAGVVHGDDDRGGDNS
jgi:hypothetical protein